MFKIGDLARLSGVPEGTLRMWERRHGFPAPDRLANGHRRYSERDLELVRRVAEARASGLRLSVAIERARQVRARPASSLFAALRRARPELAPTTLTKPMMLALSHAIEDESLSRAERPILFGAFQRERFYREAESRWSAFAEQAEVAAVFADFPELRVPERGAAEIPLERDHPFIREWGVVCDAPGHAACLVGWEPPRSGHDGAGRMFEAIWTVDPELVRFAGRVCAELAALHEPERMAPARARLAADPEPAAGEQLRLATAITTRTLAYVAAR